MGKRSSGVNAPPSIEVLAQKIPDPIVRLRFLRTAAPIQRPAGRSPARRRRILWILLPLVAVLLAAFLAGVGTRPAPAKAVPPLPVVWPAASPVPTVWRVETTADSETYSNGLRIDTRFVVATHPRFYEAFPRNGSGAGVPGTAPVGIVFHTTESRQAPFEALQNRVLQRIGASLVDYVRHRRAYNFLIDRFGRVYRIVPETDAANHAGYSVWADAQAIYVNLNESFLGVSVESQTEPGQLQGEMSPAQERAVAMLVEMLRSRFAITTEDCVTHGQVSVNPSNMRAGYHTDWASGFPFERVGLPDNYARPLASLWAFGFDADALFQNLAGDRMAAGIRLAEQILEADAAHAGVAPAVYRRSLRQRYRERLSQQRGPQ